MMKFGFCASTVTSSAARTGEDMFEAAVSAGFDYIELPAAQFSVFSDEEFAAYVGKLKALSLPCLVCNNLFPATIPLTGKSSDMNSILEYFVRISDRIQELGAERVVFGSPGARHVPDGFPYETAYEQLQEILGRIAPVAMDHNFEIAIEPIAVATSNIINTLNEAEKLALSTGCSNVGTMAEYYQMLHQDGDMDSLKSCCGELLRHVHIANSMDHAYPSINDGENYEKFFRLLHVNGYSGTVSIEGTTQSKDFIMTSKSALELLRSLEK